MKINKIEPHGYCGGVTYALKMANDYINKENVYMIGKIIHNDIVCNDLEKKGIIIKTNSKIDAINEINNGTVIFTAHGTDEAIINMAKSKQLNVVDTTCKKVNIVKDNIKKHLNTSTILYIGVKNHPECEAILSISPNIILINDINDVYNLDKNINYYITNQTTLSLLKLKEIYSYIENNFTNVIIDNKICLATTRRQQAVLDCSADCIIVIGDKKSSNTNELYNIAKTKCDSYLITNYLELPNLEKYSNIKITSGASTPEYLVDETINHINTIYKHHIH